MNCDRCGRPSVYHSTLIVNGVSQTTNLCHDCAIKEGVFDNSPTSIFDDMFDVFSSFLPYEKENDVKCPVCKTSLREFKTTHKLGCPNCYEAFREEVKAVLSRTAPNNFHKIEASTTKNKGESKQDKIASLRAEKALAVKEERYEDAGKIKKQIQKLEAEND